MVKNLLKYIFIYTLLVGCDTQSISNNDECESDCFLKVDAPNLQLDDNGFYHIEWLEGYNQTFSTLDANTGSDEIQKVYWDSDSGIEYMNEWVSCVNHASYTNDGIAHTVLAVWEEMIGDTITIYAEFTDWCSIQWVDSMKVVVVNEFEF